MISLESNEKVYTMISYYLKEKRCHWKPKRLLERESAMVVVVVVIVGRLSSLAWYSSEGHREGVIFTTIPPQLWDPHLSPLKE